MAIFNSYVKWPEGTPAAMLGPSRCFFVFAPLAVVPWPGLAPLGIPTFRPSMLYMTCLVSAPWIISARWSARVGTSHLFSHGWSSLFIHFSLICPYFPYFSQVFLWSFWVSPLCFSKPANISWCQGQTSKKAWPQSTATYFTVRYG